MNQQVLRVCEAVREAGGRGVLVGGWVRDWLRGFESKDFDLEVYGLDAAKLRSVLESIARVNTVGEHFSVYKLVFRRDVQDLPRLDDVGPLTQRVEMDVSIPRRESKSGRGHRAFIIEGDPSMTPEEAARRRDFTINAVMYDPLTDEMIDPFGGAKDLEQGVLRAVAADTFVEDSLRVLRAVQLAARFEMTIEPRTAELCRNIDLSDLPAERIWGEIEKLLSLAERPSIGLRASLELRVLHKLFPELAALDGSEINRPPASDSSGFTNTALSLDQAVKLARSLSKPERITLMLATLCHDLGLAGGASASRNPGGVELVAVERASAVLKTLGVHTIAGYDVRSQVLALVREQKRPAQFYETRAQVSDGDFRRLAQRVDIDLLYRLAKACALAREGELRLAEDWFMERARELGVEHGPPEPLLLGRHLIEAGYEPGPRMGQILREVYEFQLDGTVRTLDEALACLASMP